MDFGKAGELCLFISLLLLIQRTFAAPLKDEPNDILTVLLCTVGFLLV